MRAERTAGETHRRRPSKLWLVDLAAVAALALVVRVAFAQAVVVPPADDPAYYASVARNLHDGRGFVSDVIWQYSRPPASITHPAGDLWMPLPAGLMALVFAVAGPGWAAAQVPGILAGTALAALTYLVGRQLLAGERRARLLSACAALLVALNGILAYQSASGDSAALFSVLAAAALWLVGRSEEQPGAAGPPAAAGLLLGLAYLARSDALFVLIGLVVLVVGGVRLGVSRPSWRCLAVMAVTACLVVAPWLARNAVVFGTPTPAPVGLLASITRYEELFSYGEGAPGGLSGSLDLATAAGLRATALWHNAHSVLDFLFFPTVLLPLVGLWILRSRPGAGGAVSAFVVTASATAVLFPVPSMAGTFYHDAGAFAPWLAVGLVHLLRRGMNTVASRRKWRSDLLGLALALAFVVTVAQLALTFAAVSARHRGEARQMSEVTTYLAGRPAAPVISNLPYNLYWQARLPGLSLPSLQEPAAAIALAERYGASRLVVLGQPGMYPGVLAGGPACGSAARQAPIWCQAAVGSDWRIFELN